MSDLGAINNPGASGSTLVATFLNIGETGTTASSANVANTTKLWAINTLADINGVTKIAYNIGTADNTANLYDLGLYNSSGTLVLHIGATAGTTFAPSTGAKVLATTGSANVPAGKYYIALTGQGTAALGGQAATPTVACGNNPATNNATSGGVLNSSVTFNADALTACTMPGISLSTL